MNRTTILFCQVAMAFFAWQLSEGVAHSLIVTNPNPASSNYLAPTTAATGLANPDPGWANAVNNFSGIYLGNQWVMQTRHQIGAGVPSTVVLDSGTFVPIPGSRIDLKNPTGLGLSATSDIILYRIDTADRLSGTPEMLADAMGAPIQPISIADSTPGLNTQVMFLSRGVTKGTNNLRQWNVDPDPDNDPATPNWSWTPTASGGDFSGFAGGSGPRLKAWGTNNVELNSVMPDNPNNPFTKIGDDWALSISGRDTFLKAVEFGSSGGLNEAQGVAGDSGSSVFSQVDGEWKLAGITHVVYTFPNQPGPAVYGSLSGGESGSLTAFSDLSLYRDELTTLLAQSDYSLPGDINLDGQVTGDGTGLWENDDVTAFVEGWGQSLAEANILSWKQGDLNQDGLTNLADFLILRESIGGSAGASLNLAVLLNVPLNVPEPSSVVIACLFMAMLGSWKVFGRFA